jgi:hypothetical protein
MVALRRFALAATSAPGGRLPIVSDDGAEFFAVRNWQVFRPGYHKGRLYTKADIQQIVANFQRLSVGPDAYLKPRGKIGHDDDQSIRKSLGLPSAGRITACRLTPDGGFEIDVEHIPSVGIGPDGVKYDFRAAMEHGVFPDGSVELVWGVPDPDSPSQSVPGAVIEGVAFLGEEQPGVTGLPAPRVSDVSPASGRQFTAVFSATIRGRQCQLRRVRFSEVSPVNRDQLLQDLRDKAGVDVGDPQISAMTDDQLAALHKQLVGQDGMGSEGVQMSAKKRYAAMPTPAPANPDAAGDKQDLKAMFAKTMADFEKRFGAMEQTIQGMQPQVQDASKFSKTYEADKAAAHQRAVEETVAQAVKDGRIAPADVPAHTALGLTQGNTTRFSAADGASKAGLTPYEVWRRDLLARPVDARFSSQIDDGGSDVGASQIDDFVSRIENRQPRNAQLRFPPAKAA